MDRQHLQQSGYVKSTGYGHTGTRETVEGRVYYPNGGGLRGEYRATRDTVSDPRLLPTAPHPFTVWLRATVRWWTDWVIIAGALSVGVGAAYSGWVLGNEVGVAIMVAAVTTIYNSCWGRQ